MNSDLLEESTHHYNTREKRQILMHHQKIKIQHWSKKSDGRMRINSYDKKY